jgi:hypothetical protein
MASIITNEATIESKSHVGDDGLVRELDAIIPTEPTNISTNTSSSTTASTAVVTTNGSGNATTSSTLNLIEPPAPTVVYPTATIDSTATTSGAAVAAVPSRKRKTKADNMVATMSGAADSKMSKKNKFTKSNITSSAKRYCPFSVPHCLPPFSLL